MKTRNLNLVSKLLSILGEITERPESKLRIQSSARGAIIVARIQLR